MNPKLISEQLDLVQRDNSYLFYTQEFQNFLKALISGKNLGREDFEVFLKDKTKLELNLGLFSRYADIALAHFSDDAKVYIVDVLHDLYFSRKHEDSGEEMKTLMVKAVKSISDLAMRKKALLKVRAMLDEDSCCVELKNAVEDVLRIDDPGFKWN